MKKVKVLVLFSGGLDSAIAAEVLKNQRVKILGVYFKSYFFDNSKVAKNLAKSLKIPLKIIDISKEHLKIVKKPKYGYGSAMNPCIDCHILMLKKAKEIMGKNSHADFVATGEVLGQRPFSQNKNFLKLIEKESSLKGYLLRPLSAKLLEKTIPERTGLIKREELLDISGRSRKKQLKLAKSMKISGFLTPAGGCLLTDSEFSKKLKKLFKIKYANSDKNDISLLKIGRHFFEKNYQIIIGRNEKEDKEIKKLARKKDTLIEMKNYPGPLTLLRKYKKGKIPQKILDKAKNLTQYYSTKSRGKKDVEFIRLTEDNCPRSDLGQTGAAGGTRTHTGFLPGDFESPL